MRLFKQLFLYVSTAILFIACGEDRTYEYYKLTEENQWIYAQMQQYYLWGDLIKEPERNKFFSASSDFFYSLLQKNDNTSHFADSATLTSYGMTFAIMRDPLGIKPSKSYAAVLFVEPGSPADKAGIKRGTWIARVGKSDVSTSNYGYLERGDATTLFTSNIVPDSTGTEFVWESGDTLNISQAVEIAPVAIVLDTIYNIPDHKVGYVICNRFADSSSIEPVLSHFAAENITDLIIDLRYNSGGSLQTAAAFASMIAPQAQGGLFCSLSYNEANSDKNRNYCFSEQSTALELSRIFILTTNATRGAAEAFAASMRMNLGDKKVVLLGGSSAGRNLYTQSIESPFDFVINPAVATICAPNGEAMSSYGFGVDYEVSEFTNPLIEQLGNINEQMLYSTLYYMLNGTLPDTEIMKSPLIRTVYGKNIVIE